MKRRDFLKGVGGVIGGVAVLGNLPETGVAGAATVIKDAVPTRNDPSKRAKIFLGGVSQPDSSMIKNSPNPDQARWEEDVAFTIGLIHHTNQEGFAIQKVIFEDYGEDSIIDILSTDPQAKIVILSTVVYLESQEGIMRPNPMLPVEDENGVLLGFIDYQ